MIVKSTPPAVSLLIITLLRGYNFKPVRAGALDQASPAGPVCGGVVGLCVVLSCPGWRLLGRGILGWRGSPIDAMSVFTRVGST